MDDLENNRLCGNRDNRIAGIVKPTATYGFIGLNTNGVRGVSEIRAIFGGLFIGLGIVPLFLGPVAYQMLGITYLAIAA